MPFDNAGLNPLVATAGFTLWYYRTTDTRAATLVAGYFSPAASRLATGDLLIVQASDAMAFQPVRAGTLVASGLVIDTNAPPFRVNRTASQRFSVRQVVGAVVTAVLLAPLAGGITSNGVVQAQAAVTGAVAQVQFSIRDAGGATVRGPVIAAVAAGSASATLPAPAIGSGYRLRVEATDMPEIADTSPPFAVTAPYAVLLQDGSTLLAEDSSRLLV